MTIHQDTDDLIRTNRVPLCLICQRLTAPVAGVWTCRAYPQGIPSPIWQGSSDHREPYPGDHGIRFEPDWMAPTEILALLTVNAKDCKAPTAEAC